MASAPSVIRAPGLTRVARAIPKNPTTTLPFRVDIVATVGIERELTVFRDPEVAANGAFGSTPANALIVPAADSGLEKVHVQALGPEDRTTRR